MVFRKYPAENCCMKQKNIRLLKNTTKSFIYLINNSYLGSDLVSGPLLSYGLSHFPDAERIYEWNFLKISTSQRYSIVLEFILLVVEQVPPC